MNPIDNYSTLTTKYPSTISMFAQSFKKTKNNDMYYNNILCGKTMKPIAEDRLLYRSTTLETKNTIEEYRKWLLDIYQDEEVTQKISLDDINWVSEYLAYLN